MGVFFASARAVYLSAARRWAEMPLKARRRARGLIRSAIARGALWPRLKFYQVRRGSIPLPCFLAGRSLATIDERPPMSDGAMQEFPLTLDRFLAHAAKWHPRAEVVTAREDGAIDRVGDAELKERSLRAGGARGSRGGIRR